MNRAILIVICDFLVSAMLSMMTGMVPAHTGGTGVGLDSRTTALLLTELRSRQTQLEETRRKLLEAQQKEGFTEAREAALRELAAQLAENMLKAEKLEQQLAATRENTGSLTPEQLQERLDREIRNRYQLRIQYDEARAELEALRKNYTSASGDIVRLNQEFAVARQKLADARERLDETKGQLDENKEELQATRDELRRREERLSAAAANLAKAREALAAREADLTNVRTALSEAAARAGKATQEAQNLESDLSFTRGRLSAAERELAEARSQIERTRKLAAARELEGNEAKRQLEEMSRMFKNAVAELSRTKQELKKSQETAASTGVELAEAQGKVESTQVELEAARNQLSAAEERLRSDVLDRYSDAAIRLDFKLDEKRLLLNQHGGGVFFLPLVMVGGRTVLPGYFSIFAGDANVPLNFERISRLDYHAGRLGSGDVAEVKGPILIVSEEPRVAALELAPPEGAKPLAAITIEQLKQRGLQDLFLFKTSSFGKDSASLGGRCSIDLASNDRYLYIRNTSRGTGSELRAEPGDFVMTREGDFVGVVVSVENFDFGRRQEAKCFVFPADFNWNNAPAITTDRKGNEEYFDSFAEQVRNARENIRKFVEKK